MGFKHQGVLVRSIKKHCKRSLSKVCKKTFATSGFAVDVLDTRHEKSSENMVKLQGECVVKLNEINIFQGVSQEDKIYVCGWIDSHRNTAIAECTWDDKNEKHKFSIDVQIPDNNPSEFVKLALYHKVMDTETGLVKMFPIETCAISMRERIQSYMQTKTNEFDMTSENAFSSNLVTSFHIKCLNIHKFHSVNCFCESPLRKMLLYDKAVEDLASKIEEHLSTENLRPPQPAKQFIRGLTYLPFGGVSAQNIPPMRVQYGIMGAMFQTLDRTYPLSFPMYFMHMSMTQNGYTVDDVDKLMCEGCKNTKFMDFVSDVLLGFTKDALCFPYQRDTFPAIEFMKKGGETYFHGTLESGEDIGVPGTFADLFTEADKTLDAKDAPRIRYGMTMSQLKAIFKDKEYESLSRSFGKDDCESSCFAALMLSKTIMKGNWSIDNLQKIAADTASLNGLTPACLRRMSMFFTKLSTMFNNGTLQVSPVIGLAGAAAASDSSDEGGIFVPKHGESISQTDVQHRMLSTVNIKKQSIDACKTAGGHCYAVLRVLHDDNTVCNVLLEGTNSIYRLRTEDITAHVGHIQHADGTEQKVVIDTCKLASFLSHSVSEMTQLCVDDTPIKENDTNGIPGGVNYGRTRAQMAVYLPNPSFYLWCVYAGVTTPDTKVLTDVDCGGKVDRDTPENVYGVIPCSLNKLSLNDDCLAAGCFPGDLLNQDLQGIKITNSMISDEHMNIGKACLNEICPPNAPEHMYTRLINSWEPLKPLADINQEHRNFRDKFISKFTSGDASTPVKWICVNSSESAESPHLTECMFAMKSKIVELTNKKQLADPHWDGAYLTVNKCCTGVNVTTCFPVMTRELTLMRNLREAVHELEIYK
jgi:hypothetical protein